MDIGRLDGTMVDDALRLSRQAGWGLRRDDWQLILDEDDVLALGGSVGGELIATTTIARYGPLGWVGSVIVDEVHEDDAAYVPLRVRDDEDLEAVMSDD